MNLLTYLRQKVCACTLPRHEDSTAGVWVITTLPGNDKAPLAVDDALFLSLERQFRCRRTSLNLPTLLVLASFIFFFFSVHCGHYLWEWYVCLPQGTHIHSMSLRLTDSLWKSWGSSLRVDCVLLEWAVEWIEMRSPMQIACWPASRVVTAFFCPTISHSFL